MSKRPLDKSINKNPNGNYIFADFSGGLYLLDTPRSMGEQLATLALVGGRNVWSEKGALIPQYGYTKLGTIPTEDKVIAVSKDAQNSSSFFVVTLSGVVYFYTAWQGLKKYKTTLPSELALGSNIVTARKGDNLVLASGTLKYQFGSYYANSAEVVIENNASITTLNSIYSITVKYENKDYYWNNKHILVKVGDTSVHAKITGVQIDKDNTTSIIVRAIAIDAHQDLTGTNNVTIAEKTIRPITMVYKPEDTQTGGGSITIGTPKVMEFAGNRLVVTDETGAIYYSNRCY